MDGSVEEVAGRLAERLWDEPDVAVAYLYGSTARGTPGPLSDVDVAVLLSGDGNHHRRRLELIGLVSEVVSSDKADVVLLNDAPPAFAYRVLRDGRLLVCRDEGARVRHWTRTVVRYLDMAPMRRVLEEGQRQRLAEGRFGRP